jgi:hypothetical protein
VLLPIIEPEFQSAISGAPGEKRVHFGRKTSKLCILGDRSNRGVYLQGLPTERTTVEPRRGRNRERVNLDSAGGREGLPIGNIGTYDKSTKENVQ